MEKNYWFIDNQDFSASTLKECKEHIKMMYTPKEQQACNGDNIIHVVNDETVSTCEIIIKGDKVTFGRVKKN